MPFKFPSVEPAAASSSDIGTDEPAHSCGSEDEHIMKKEKVQLFFDNQRAQLPYAAISASDDYTPAALPGCEWWQSDILEACAPDRAALGKQMLPFKLFSSYTGTMPQVPVAEAFSHRCQWGSKQCGSSMSRQRGWCHHVSNYQ